MRDPLLKLGMRGSTLNRRLRKRLAFLQSLPPLALNYKEKQERIRLLKVQIQDRKLSEYAYGMVGQRPPSKLPR